MPAEAEEGLVVSSWAGFWVLLGVMGSSMWTGMGGMVGGVVACLQPRKPVFTSQSWRGGVARLYLD